MPDGVPPQLPDDPNMKWDDDFFNMYQSLLPNGTPRYKHEDRAFFINPGDRTVLDKLNGIPVYESNQVPEGKVYFADVKPPEARWNPTENLIQDIAASVWEQLDRVMLTGLRRAGSWAFPEYMPPEPQPPAWHRRSSETVFDWGERLSQDSYLDDPNIRWQYQKAVFKALGLKLQRWWKR